MKLGIIGGSGLEKIDHIEPVGMHEVDTPFGKPSAPILEGVIGGTTLFFLPRHGKGHTIMPSELNHRANIYALKTLGVTHILSISAVGSLQEQYVPRDVVIIDQFYDRTKSSASHSFFGDGIVAHIAFAHPICPCMASLAVNAAQKALAELPESGGRRSMVHHRGTYVNMEGPAFSTAAEPPSTIRSASETRLSPDWPPDWASLNSFCTFSSTSSVSASSAGCRSTC